MADATGRILFANPAAAELFGYDSGELIRLPIDVLVAEGLQELHAEHRADYLAAPSPRAMRAGSALVGRRKDGTEIAIEVTLNAEGYDVIVAAGGVEGITTRHAVRVRTPLRQWVRCAAARAVRAAVR